MKHMGVILFAYLLSLILMVLPVVIFEGLSEHKYFHAGVAAFFYYSILGFPLISIFMTVHHFALYLILKKDLFRLNFLKRILMGTGLSFLYVPVFFMNGQFDRETLFVVIAFAYLAFVYEMASRLMKKLNWWTLICQKG